MPETHGAAERRGPGREKRAPVSYVLSDISGCATLIVPYGASWASPDQGKEGSVRTLATQLRGKWGGRLD